MPDESKDLVRMAGTSYGDRWRPNTPSRADNLRKCNPGFKLEFCNFADEEPESRLVRAVFDGGLKDVQEALIKRSANVDLPAKGRVGHPMSGDEPLWLYFTKWLDHDVHNKGTTVTNIMVEQMVLKSQDVSGPLMSDMSEIIGKENIEQSSSVFLAAIRETGGFFRWDLESLFAGHGDATNPHHSARVSLRAKVITVHDRIRERLNNPKTDLEISAAERLTQENRAYWKESLTFPDLSSLPMPSKEFLAAVSDMGASAVLFTEVVIPHMQKGIRPSPEAQATVRELLREIKDAEIEARIFGPKVAPERRDTNAIINDLKGRQYGSRDSKP